MSDIAEATNVGPSALYRHFPRKADLLVTAIHDGIAPFLDALSPAGDAEADAVLRLTIASRRLAGAAIEHRRLGVLWQRDARNLAEDEQRALREELRATTDQLAHLLQQARPELDEAQADALAWCSMGALVSLGFHAIEMPRPGFDELMVDIVSGVNATAMPAGRSSGEGIPGGVDTPPETRRDELIAIATTLIADRGFAAAAIDDIGDAAGIAGPSVYTHFANKQEILTAAIQRANDILQDDLDAVLSSGETAERKLARLVDFYVRLASRDRSIIRTLISDMDQLLPEVRESARRNQRRYIEGWVELLRARGETDPIAARLRVQAVLLFVNDAVQTPHLRSLPAFEQILAAISKNVLGLPAAPSAPQGD